MSAMRARAKAWVNKTQAQHEEEDTRARESFQVGGTNDLSKGLTRERKCTDVFCIAIFVMFQMGYVSVTLAGLTDGDPSKLYLPRDYTGSYCATEINWNRGPNTLNAPYQSFTMNLSAIVEPTMKQAMCSSVAKRALVFGDAHHDKLLRTEEHRLAYLCECCLIPCSGCKGSLQVGGDLKTPDEFREVIEGRMTELTQSAADIYDPAGYNGAAFSSDNFWKNAKGFLQQVCLADCQTDFRTTANADPQTLRNYTYVPDRDTTLHHVWVALRNAPTTTLTAPLHAAMDTFTFKALPESMCPYPPEKCVPMPGMEFVELSAMGGRCTFKFAADVACALGQQLADVIPGVGTQSFSKGSESFGEMMGAFQATIDTFVLTTVIAFIVGLIFLVVFRFFITYCVWFAIVSTILLFAFGGAMLFVLSEQCRGASLLDTGRQRVVSVTAVAATWKANGRADETLTGDGADYRGVQSYTVNGRSCLEWDKQTVWQYYTSANFPEANLTKNFCRNPYAPTDKAKASTIWCITSDVNMPWEECRPVGIMRPTCALGFAVPGEASRKALYWSSWFLWCMGGVWLVVIMCFMRKIQVGIALNEVAARFLSQHPLVLILPAVQGALAFVWCLSWFLSASFLLSQVPDLHVPKGSFATFAEAYGTKSTCAFWESGDDCEEGVTGKCRSRWPVGSVWKDSQCDEVNDVVRCWRCAQPQYNFDTRFAFSLFVFLWDNAFLIAFSQTLISFCVAHWWFSEQRGYTRVIMPSLWLLFRYHLGSIMLGSFLVATVQFARICVKYFEKQAGATKNRVVTYLLKALQCVLWAFEKCIKFMSKNAYIQIALTGRCFFSAAKAAYYLILRNYVRFGVVATLGLLVHCVGFLFIFSFTVVLGYILVRAMHSDVSPFIPVLSYAFLGYMMASMFMTVLSLAVDTSLQLFIICEEMQEGCDQCPEELRSALIKYESKEPHWVASKTKGFLKSLTFMPSNSARE